MEAKDNDDYKLIPMSEITDEARKLAVAWMECEDKNWIGQKHKLASDIMNYAKKYHASLDKQIESGKEIPAGAEDDQKLKLNAIKCLHLKGVTANDTVTYATWLRIVEVVKEAMQSNNLKNE